MENLEQIMNIVQKNVENQSNLITRLDGFISETNKGFENIHESIKIIEYDVHELKHNEELENDKYCNLNKLKIRKVEMAIKKSNEVIRRELFSQISKTITEQYNLSSLPKIKKKDEDSCRQLIMNFHFDYSNAAVSKCRKLLKKVDKCIETDNNQLAKEILYDYNKCLNLMNSTDLREYSNHIDYMRLMDYVKKERSF